ncbi:hypothetical protein BDW69DRAFT_167091 [Aspergillus filifer]
MVSGGVSALSPWKAIVIVIPFSSSFTYTSCCRVLVFWHMGPFGARGWLNALKAAIVCRDVMVGEKLALFNIFREWSKLRIDNLWHFQSFVFSNGSS